MQINSLVNFYILLMLNEKPKYGYELIKEVGGKLERKVSPSQVYPFLTVLSNKGIVFAERSGNRDKKTYRLSAKGKVFVSRLVSRFAGLINASLSSNLTLCAHCGCSVYGTGFRQKFGRRQLSFCCQYCAASFSP